MLPPGAHISCAIRCEYQNACGRAAIEASGRTDLWAFLAERPRSHKQGDFLFVHGSGRNPLHEYVFPEDVFNAAKMAALMDRYCFCGHAHVPGVFVDSA